MPPKPRSMTVKVASLISPLPEVRRVPVQTHYTNRLNASHNEAPPGPKHTAYDLPERAVKGMRAIPLIQLRRNECKWPVSESKRRGHLFCGLPTPDGRPYCLHHHQFAYPRAREAANA